MGCDDSGPRFRPSRAQGWGVPAFAHSWEAARLSGDDTVNMGFGSRF